MVQSVCRAGSVQRPVQSRDAAQGAERARLAECRADAGRVQSSTTGLHKGLKHARDALDLRELNRKVQFAPDVLLDLCRVGARAQRRHVDQLECSLLWPTAALPHHAPHSAKTTFPDWRALTCPASRHLLGVGVAVDRWARTHRGIHSCRAWRLNRYRCIRSVHSRGAIASRP